MPEFDFIGVVLAAVIAGVISFSLVMLRKVSDMNEVLMSTKTKTDHIEPRLNAIEEHMKKISERIEELKSNQRLDEYRIDEIEKGGKNVL